MSVENIIESAKKDSKYSVTTVENLMFLNHVMGQMIELENKLENREPIKLGFDWVRKEATSQ